MNFRRVCARFFLHFSGTDGRKGGFLPGCRFEFEPDPRSDGWEPKSAESFPSDSRMKRPGETGEEGMVPPPMPSFSLFRGNPLFRPVFLKRVQKNPFPFCHAGFPFSVHGIFIVFHAPDVAFTKRMKTPGPAVLLEQRNHIPQKLVRSGGPADTAEFSHKNLRSGLHLKRTDFSAKGFSDPVRTGNVTAANIRKSVTKALSVTDVA